ncbi:hypothetical protein BAE44_0016779, partial [Dichanthelium oligosanthes]
LIHRRRRRRQRPPGRSREGKLRKPRAMLKMLR